MSKIIGVTVGTPISATKIEEEIKPVKTVNNKAPDDSGNVNIEVSGGGIDEEQLQEAVEDALEAAKASGEFDGEDGADGKDGVSVTHSWNGTTLTVTSASGTSSADLKGAKGDDGTSVGISNIQQSELDGDFSTITFTDGKSLNVYNGKKGSNGTNGTNGTSVTVSNVSESTASGGTNTVTFSDGKKVNIKNGKDGSDGTNGADGGRGTGILKVSTAPDSYSTVTGGRTPTKRMKISTIKSEAGVTEVLVGDTICQSYYLRPIYYLDDTYAYMETYTSIRGASGSAGASSEWYVGTGITGTSTTDTIFSGSGVSSATVGDMYLNTSTYNIYRCSTAGAASAAKWVYVCNIKGTKGDKGDAYTLTDTDKNTIASAVKSSLPTLTMVGVDADGVSHTWTIYGS